MKPGHPKEHVFWIIATGFLDAARASHDLILAPFPEDPTKAYRGFVWFPATFLFFRTIELDLKACLDRHGVEEREFRIIGHSISGLVDRLRTLASQTSLGPIDQYAEFLLDHSNVYAEKWFEYPAGLWDVRFGSNDIAVLRRAAEEITEFSRTYRLHSNDADTKEVPQ